MQPCQEASDVQWAESWQEGWRLFSHISQSTLLLALSESGLIWPSMAFILFSYPYLVLTQLLVLFNLRETNLKNNNNCFQWIQILGLSWHHSLLKGNNTIDRLQLFLYNIIKVHNRLSIKKLIQAPLRSLERFPFISTDLEFLWMEV